MYSPQDCYKTPKDSDLHKFGIYCIENKVNGRQYVGSTIRSFSTRIKVHFKALKKGVHHSKKFQGCFNKHKEEDYYIKILEILKTKDYQIVRDREQYWLDTLEPFYNMVKDSNFYGGCKHSEDSKKKRIVNYRLRSKDKDIGAVYCPPENNWSASIRVTDITVAFLGRFKTEKEALAAHKKAQSVFWTQEFEALSVEDKKEFVERYRNARPRTNSTSNHRYISFNKGRGQPWRFTYKSKFVARFYTLEEAVEFRDKYLEENNLI